MARYQVNLAYDGTLFRGFQRQANARTVQGVVEHALCKLGWQSQSILSAGRTDTGVHASGQVIAFDLVWRHTPEELCEALNANLPEDVVARQARMVLADFHPRYDAESRRYRYRLFCDTVRNPFVERYAWRVLPSVDPVILDETAAMLIGTYDYACFGTPPRAGDSTIRTISQAGWGVESEEEMWLPRTNGMAILVFEIAAKAFLYHMVRRLVSLQVSIAQGKCGLETLKTALQGPLPGKPAEQQIVQGLAPAHGLMLVEVLYSEECYI